MRKNFLDLTQTVFSRFNKNFQFKESDILISSFPKSGRNWVLFLLANTMAGYGNYSIEINFHNRNQWIATDIPRHPPVNDFPRFFATHENYKGQSTKVIYLLRHPADVMISYYDYLKNRWNKDVGNFSNFLQNSDYGLPAWIKHIKSWEEHWDILVKYEDLQFDTLSNLDSMMKVIGKEVNQNVMEVAIKKSSFENMKRIEEKNKLPSKLGANSDYPFVRQGKINKGKGIFSQEDYSYLSSIAGEIMEKYGYDIPK